MLYSNVSKHRKSGGEELEHSYERLVNNNHNCTNCICLFLLEFNAILTAKVVSWRPVTHLCASWLSQTCTETTVLSKATDYYSHTSDVRGEKTLERKFSPNWLSNSHPPGQKSNTPSLELPCWINIADSADQYQTAI